MGRWRGRGKGGGAGSASAGSCERAERGGGEQGAGGGRWEEGAEKIRIVIAVRESQTPLKVARALPISRRKSRVSWIRSVFLVVRTLTDA